jgi:hypothetical protein
VLTEFSSSRPDARIRAGFDALLETAFEEGIIADAVIAESVEQQALIGSKNQIEAVMSKMEQRKAEFVDP